MMHSKLVICFLALVFASAVDPHVSRAEVDDLLFVVGNSAALTAGESTRKGGFETYGYTVTVIDDGASQASINAAAALNNVVWISPDVNETTVGTKFKSLSIGVVNEEINLADEFGICSSSVSTTSKNFINVTNNTHYITYGLPLSSVAIVYTNQTLARRTGTLASGAVNLADVENTPGQTSEGLIVVDVGGALYGGGTAAGRRVQLPVGSATFDLAALNGTGIYVFLRAIEWAARPNPSLGAVLLPVTSTASPTAQEKLRKLQLDVWGYDVTLIDDDATQATYTAGYSGKDFVYLSEEAVSTSIGTKLTACPLGVVSEKYDLSDELGLTSTSAAVAATAVSITDNTHYITSPFPAGALTIFTISQSAATVTGTAAPGLQTLGTVSTAKGLAVVESGGVLTTSTTAAGRRVVLPWGGSTFDFAALNANGKKLMRRAVEWAAASVGTKVLMVVANSTSLSTQELSRKTLLESWGYSVNIVDDDASQANFNLATSANSVAYVPETIVSTSLGTKLYSTAIGVVNEEPLSAVSLGLAGSVTTGAQSSLTVVDGTHYVTSTLGAGTFGLYSAAQTSTLLNGTTARGLQTVGQWGATPALGTIEAGARLVDGTFAAGRRVQLPWGDTGFSISALNANGQTILRRSLQWGAGLVGYWKFDESAGTVASDSSTNANAGTLSGGMTFPAQTIANGRVGRALDFNGTSHYVVVNNTAALQLTQALTVAAWIKGDSWGTGSTVNTILRKGDASPNNYQLSVANGKLEATLDGTDDLGFKGTTTLQTGKWYHVALTWDGSIVKLYVDGVLNNSPGASRSAPIGVDARALYLGGRIGSTDFFDGSLDDVRLYNYALGASEVMQLKSQGTFGVRVIKWREVQ
jgi:hypothetical protein